jgi:hypothetical protein
MSEIPADMAERDPDRGFIEPPAWQDELDIAARFLYPAPPDPDAAVSAADARASAEALAEHEPEPELEAGG